MRNKKDWKDMGGLCEAARSNTSTPKKIDLRLSSKQIFNLLLTKTIMRSFTHKSPNLTLNLIQLIAFCKGTLTKVYAGPITTAFIPEIKGITKYKTHKG